MILPMSGCLGLAERAPFSNTKSSNHQIIRNNRNLNACIMQAPAATHHAAGGIPCARLSTDAVVTDSGANSAACIPADLHHQQPATQQPAMQQPPCTTAACHTTPHAAAGGALMQQHDPPHHSMYASCLRDRALLSRVETVLSMFDIDGNVVHQVRIASVNNMSTDRSCW